jgi:ABC-type uncharacterized transport system auxiliary subunit
MRRIGRSFALGLVLLQGACVGGGPVPSEHFYRLEAATPAAFSAPPLSGVVEVGRIAGDGLTAERALLYSYRDKPGQLFRYGYHLWVEPPPVLLQNQLVRLLRETHAAPNVVTADLRVPPDFLIEGRLHRFEQVVGAPLAVVVDIDLGVVRLRNSELLLFRSYRAETPAAGDQPADAVLAYQAAVSDIFGRFLADLAEKQTVR